jgi:phage/plasmid-associated DNA primase
MNRSNTSANIIIPTVAPEPATHQFVVHFQDRSLKASNSKDYRKCEEVLEWPLEGWSLQQLKDQLPPPSQSQERLQDW